MHNRLFSQFFNLYLIGLAISKNNLINSQNRNEFCFINSIYLSIYLLIHHDAKLANYLISANYPEIIILHIQQAIWQITQTLRKKRHKKPYLTLE